MTMLILACAAFVGTHFLLSHPLRAPIVGRIGEGPFLGLYSLVALLTLAWMGYAFHRAPAQEPYWAGGMDRPWALATLVMLGASILFTGSLARNPAAPDPTGHQPLDRPATGVFAITRHPMMWAFALWGVAHILVMPTPADIVLCGSIILLALGGAWGQQLKKRRLQGDAWRAWEARTSFLPFAALFAGRVRLRDTVPGIGVIMTGTLLWLVATLAHGRIGAGIWRWVL